MKNEKATERVRNTTAQRKQASPIAPSTDRLRRVDARNKGHRRSKKRPTTISAGTDVTDAFLKCTFTPKLTDDALLEGVEEQKFQTDFYQSLSLLAELYGIEYTIPKELEFPYNVWNSLHDVLSQLRERSYGHTDINLVEHQGDIFFAKRTIYDTKMTLFYIPVVSLYEMLKSPENRQCALLLLSVFTYLYKIADLPYYTQECSYLSDMYGFVDDWHYDSGEDIDPIFLHECKQSKVIGDIMERKIAKTENLTYLQARINAFKIRSEFDKKCHEIAVRCSGLMQDYPNSTIYSKIDCDQYYIDNESIIIGFDQIVSFCADNRGLLFDDLFSLVNGQLMEYSAIEEPTIYVPIDKRHIDGNNLEFEERLFALIEDLISQLDEFRNIK